jgi:hypothetical protein
MTASAFRSGRNQDRAAVGPLDAVRRVSLVEDGRGSLDVLAASPGFLLIRPGARSRPGPRVPLEEHDTDRCQLPSHGRPELQHRAFAGCHLHGELPHLTNYSMSRRQHENKSRAGNCGRETATG